MEVNTEDCFQSSSPGSNSLHSVHVQVSPPPSASSPNTSGCSQYKKPPFSYSQLVVMSLENSQEKTLELREIYSWIEKVFPYYKNALTGWRGSIRHELSHKNYYKKVKTKFSKGVWSVDRIYRPKLYAKFKSFLNHDGKLNQDLNKCLCESVSKYDLFSFLTDNNEDEINAAKIIIELKNQNESSVSQKESSPKVTKQTKRKHNAGKKQYNSNSKNKLNFKVRKINVEIEPMKDAYWPSINGKEESMNLPPNVVHSCVPEANVTLESGIHSQMITPNHSEVPSERQKSARCRKRDARLDNSQKKRQAVLNNLKFRRKTLEKLDQSIEYETVIQWNKFRLTALRTKLFEEELQKIEEERELTALERKHQVEWRELRMTHERELRELRM